MKLSPISFNLNNQVRNNKIQNQPKLKPMASDSVSFGATIPWSVIGNARNDIASDFFAEREFDTFLSLDKAGRQEVISSSTEEQRKAVYNEKHVNIAIKKGKIKELLEIPQTDDELFELLGCQGYKRIGDEFRTDRSIDGPLKNFLSFQDALMVLEKLKKVESKKQFLNDSWANRTYSYTENRFFEGTRTTRDTLAQQASLNDEQKLNRILLEVIQDDSTSEKEAAELAFKYARCVDSISRYYLYAFGKYFESQIEE